MSRGRDRGLVVAIVVTALVGAVVEWSGLGRGGGGARFTDGDRHLETPPAERFVAWSDPEPLSVDDRSAGTDAASGVALGPAGRTRVWAVGTPGHNVDLWIAERDPGGRWTSRRLDEVSSERDDLSPALSPDGSRLVFASDRPGGHGGFDLWVAERRGARFGEPRNVGPVVNAATDDVDPCVAPSGALVFASRRGGRFDLFAAEPAGDGWRAPVAIDGVNGDADDRAPAIAGDGRTLWFASDRAGGSGGLDLYRTVRFNDAWLPPAPVTALNTAADESDPAPSDEGFTLCFARAGALLHAESREFFRWSTPTRAGLSRVGSFVVLLLILLMALYLARRWAEMGILGRSVVASLIAHLILFLYLNEVMVGGGLDVPVAERRFRVTMARPDPRLRAAEVARGDAPADVARAAPPTVARDRRPLAATTPAARALTRAEARSPAAPEPTAVARDATRAETRSVRVATRVPDAPTRRARPPVVAAERTATAVEPAPRRAPERPMRAVAAPAPPAAVVARAASAERAPSVASPTVDPARRTPRTRRAPDGPTTSLAKPAEPTRVARTASAPAPAPRATSVAIAARAVTTRPSVTRDAPSPTMPPRSVDATPAARAMPVRAPTASPTPKTPRPPATREPASGSALALATPDVPARASAAPASAARDERAPVAVALAARPMPRRLDRPRPTPIDRGAPVGPATSAARPASARVAPTPDPRSPRRTAPTRDARRPSPAVALAVPALPAPAAARPAPMPAPERTARATPEPVERPVVVPEPARAVPVVRAAPRRGARSLEPRRVATALPVEAPERASRPRPTRGAAASPSPSPSTAVRLPTLAARAARVPDPDRTATPVPTRVARATPVAPRPLPDPVRTRPVPPAPSRVDAASLARAHRATPMLVADRRSGPRDTLARAAGLFDRRAGDAKLRALRDYGGTEASEAAVRNGLAYLARIQHDSGAWGDPGYRHRKYGHVEVGKTALCALAFLGSGHTPRSKTRYSDVTARAIRYLLSQQNERGHIGRGSSYGHGIATYALAEAYAMTRDPALRAPLMRAVGRILDAQNLDRSRLATYGGWGYFYAGDRVWDAWPRASVTAWQVMALKSARIGGIAVPDEALTAARAYLRNSYDREAGSFRYSHDPDRLRSAFRTLPGSTPASMFALLILGEDPGSERIRAGMRYVMDRIPTSFERTGDRAFVLKAKGNLYFWYYATLALFTMRGDAWTTWNAHLRDLLVGAQRADGSWRPISPYANYANDNRHDRSYTTALCVLILEVYYRYVTPLLTHRPTPAAPELPDEIRSPAMEGGFEVRALDAGGAAERAGVRIGDRLHRYAGNVITDFDALRGWIRRHADDAAVGLEVVRDGAVVTLRVDGGPLGVRVRAP